MVSICYIKRHIQSQHEFCFGTASERKNKQTSKQRLIVTRTLEDLKTPLIKTVKNIYFKKTCKQENLIPTFAEVKPSIKHGNKKI